MAESDMVIGELASFGAGSLRLRDCDILVVKTDCCMSMSTLESMRAYYEKELTRLGVSEPKVLAIPFRDSIEVIERS